MQKPEVPGIRFRRQSMIGIQHDHLISYDGKGVITYRGYEIAQDDLDIIDTVVYGKLCIPFDTGVLILFHGDRLQIEDIDDMASPSPVDERASITLRQGAVLVLRVYPDDLCVCADIETDQQLHQCRLTESGTSDDDEIPTQAIQCPGTHRVIEPLELIE